MLQEGDKSILFNVAKVIAILVVVMFALIFLASYIGGGWSGYLSWTGQYSLSYNARIMDRVAFAITLLVVIICGLIAFLRVYFGNQPWSL